MKDVNGTLYRACNMAWALQKSLHKIPDFLTGAHLGQEILKVATSGSRVWVCWGAMSSYRNLKKC